MAKERECAYDVEDMREAVNTMRNGGIILYPTDTVWGIGCDATNEEAVSRIYKLKRREETKSMLVLVESVLKVKSYVGGIPDVGYDMMDITDKPLTMILDGAKNLAKNLIAEDGSIALRITQEAFSKELCYRFQKAVVSTSANISGEPAAQNYRDIAPEIIEAVDYVCWSRRQEHQPHKPSCIIRLRENGEVEIIRK